MQRLVTSVKLHSACRRLLTSGAIAGNKARIVEVGVRDGLQNEAVILPADVKLRLIELLEAAGVQNIEAGAFVSPKWVPQMASTTDIFTALKNRNNGHGSTQFSALTPNIKGYSDAIALGVKEVAVFGAASEAFSKKNINCSIAESIDRFADVCATAKSNNIRVRGYVSCVLGCPYEGDVSPSKVIEVSQRLLSMGCYEISLGDTIGVGSPGKTAALLKAVTAEIPTDKLAVHFHDTYGQALANIYVALQHGVTSIDSSVSGLGGCPYAAGASGNVATEDVVYMLHALGLDTGIQMDGLLDAADYIDGKLGGRRSSSKASLALRTKRSKAAAAAAAKK